MLVSVGELVDKLVIENLKIFNLREELHKENLSDEEYVRINNQMNILNKNRSTLSKFLDEKVENVIAGKEKNRNLLITKTYNTEEE